MPPQQLLELSCWRSCRLSPWKLTERRPRLQTAQVLYLRAQFFIDSLEPAKDNPPMNSRKTLASAILVPLLVGIIGLNNLMHNPRFAAFHSVDVLQLIGSGMCFGVALSALIAIIRAPRQA